MCDIQIQICTLFLHFHKWCLNRDVCIWLSLTSIFLCSHESVSGTSRCFVGWACREESVAARMSRWRKPNQALGWAQERLLLLWRRICPLSRGQQLQLRGGDVLCLAGGSQKRPWGNSKQHVPVISSHITEKQTKSQFFSHWVWICSRSHVQFSS